MLHAAVAERLRADPALVKRARERVRGWLASGDQSYAAGWAEILDCPMEELCALLVDPGERMRAFRQSSPFAGVLDPQTRWRIMQEARERMGV